MPVPMRVNVANLHLSSERAATAAVKSLHIHPFAKIAARAKNSVPVSKSIESAATSRDATLKLTVEGARPTRAELAHLCTSTEIAESRTSRSVKRNLHLQPPMTTKTSATVKAATFRAAIQTPTVAGRSESVPAVRKPRTATPRPAMKTSESAAGLRSDIHRKVIVPDTRTSRSVKSNLHRQPLMTPKTSATVKAATFRAAIQTPTVAKRSESAPAARKPRTASPRPTMKTYESAAGLRSDIHRKVVPDARAVKKVAVIRPVAATVTGAMTTRAAARRLAAEAAAGKENGKIIHLLPRMAASSVATTAIPRAFVVPVSRTAIPRADVVPVSRVRRSRPATLRSVSGMVTRSANRYLAVVPN